MNKNDKLLKKENEFLFRISQYTGLDKIFKEISLFFISNFGFESSLILLPVENGDDFLLLKTFFPENLLKMKNDLKKTRFYNLTIKEIFNICINDKKAFVINNFDDEKFLTMKKSFIFPLLDAKTVLIIPVVVDKEFHSLVLFNTHDAPVYIDEGDVEYIYNFLGKIAKCIKNALNFDNMNAGRSFLMDLIENSPIGVQVLSKKGDVIMTNPSFENLGIFNPDSDFIKSWTKCDNFVNNKLDKEFSSTLNGKIVSRENVPVFKENGDEILVNIIFSPIYNELNQIENVLILWQDNTEKARAEQLLAKDLKLAKRIQNSVITGNTENINGLDIEIYFSSKMEVGGDIYDIIKINSDVIRVFIADATGHGVQASLTTMLIKVEYDRIKTQKMPCEILNQLNTVFCKNYKKVFLHFTCAVFDFNLKEKRVDYSMAGHPYQTGIINKKVHEIFSRGSVIGIFEDAEYESSSFNFNFNDKVFLFTDGVIENFSETKEIYGKEKLDNVIEKNKNHNVKTIHSKIVDSFVHWRGNCEPNDDITLISIENVKK